MWVVYTVRAMKGGSRLVAKEDFAEPSKLPGRARKELNLGLARVQWNAHALTIVLRSQQSVSLGWEGGTVDRM